MSADAWIAAIAIGVSIGAAVVTVLARSDSKLSARTSLASSVAAERSATADERAVALAEQYDPDRLTLTRGQGKNKTMCVLVNRTGEKASRVRIVHGSTLDVLSWLNTPVHEKLPDGSMQFLLGDLARGDEIGFHVQALYETEPDHSRYELVWENECGDEFRRRLLA